MYQTGDLDEFHSIANAQADQAMRNEKRESEPLVLIDKGSDIGYSVCETAVSASIPRVFSLKLFVSTMKTCAVGE